MPRDRTCPKECARKDWRPPPAPELGDHYRCEDGWHLVTWEPEMKLLRVSDEEVCFDGLTAAWWEILQTLPPGRERHLLEIRRALVTLWRDN